MGIGPSKATRLDDRNYLREMSTTQLRKLLRNTSRSISELTEYQEALGDVLAEREKAADEH